MANMPMNSMVISGVLLVSPAPLLDLALEEVQVFLQLLPLLPDGAQHLEDALALLVLSGYAQVQSADAEDHLSELPLPLSILVQLSFKL